MGQACANIASGTITIDQSTGGVYQLPDESTAGNPGFLYQFTVTDTQVGSRTKGQFFVLAKVPSVTGATFALDRYFPTTSVPTAAVFTFTTGSGTPTTSCTGKAFYQDLSTPAAPVLYQCGGDSLFHVITGSGGGSTTPATPSAFGTVKLSTGQSSTTLSKVATTGVYSDLTGTPTLGSAASQPSSAFDASGAATTAQAASLQKTSNLSDLSSASTARTNLGLGTAATQASSAFDVAGAASTAQAAAIAASTPASSVAPAYLGLVATRTFTADVFNTSNTWMMNCTYHVARQAIPANSLKVVWQNLYVPLSSNVETSTVSNATYKASIEYPIATGNGCPSGGTIAGSCTFSGVTQPSVAPLADAIADVCPHAAIPNGAAFRIRMLYTNPSGILLVQANNINGAKEGAMFGTGTPNDLTGGGAVTAAGGILDFPSAIVSTTVQPSVCLVGDSREIGQADLISNTATGDSGEIARWIGPNFAYTNMGVFGTQVSQALTNYTNRLRIVQYCSHVIDQYGVNDIYSGLRTASQVASDRTAFAAWEANLWDYSASRNKLHTISNGSGYSIRWDNRIHGYFPRLHRYPMRGLDVYGCGVCHGSKQWLISMQCRHNHGLDPFKLRRCSRDPCGDCYRWLDFHIQSASQAWIYRSSQLQCIGSGRYRRRVKLL